MPIPNTGCTIVLLDMATSLYRKHRPQRFQDISGQRHILATLERQLETDRVAHAYLFAGPRGTGKTTTSRILAKAVNCLQRKAGSIEPCNTCLACVSITAGNALDVLEIDAASHTGVDHVREHIIGSSRVSPTSLRRKVFIIDEVHMLSIAAFNALLKTLEEPPGDVLFVLATTEVSKLPETIISRCQRFDFKKISAEDIIERLAALVQREGRHVDRAVLETIAANADGSVRDAESLLEQVLTLGDDPVTIDQARLVIPYSDAAAVLEFVGHLAARQLTPALEQVNRMSSDGVDLAHFAVEVAQWLRAVLLLKCDVRLPDISAALTAPQLQQLSKVSERFTMPTLVSVLTVWIARASELKHATVPQLPLELAIVEICAPAGAGEAPPVKTDAPTVAKGSSMARAAPVESAPKKPSRTPKSAETKKPAPSSAQIRTAARQEVSAPASPEVAPETPAAPSVQLEQIQQQWVEILGRVKTQNSGLFSLLRVMRPLRVVGNVVHLGVAYDFHLERVSDLKNRMIIERVLSEVYGVALRVEPIVVPDIGKPTYAAEDSQFQSLLENFGGKIME